MNQNNHHGQSKSEQGKLYVAYGSNLNIEQMKYRCPTAEVVRTAHIKDYELVFRGSRTGSFATIEPCEGKTVPILLWNTTVKDELALDFYEGYPTFYGKEDMVVEVDGQSVSAYVYIMPDSHRLGLPSQHYVDTILEGYESAGFDALILFDAIESTEQKMDDEQGQALHQFEMRW